MEKGIFVDPKKCTGCKICELVCSFRNEGNFGPLSRIRNVSDLEKAFFASITCMQCTAPDCTKVCPSGALQEDGGRIRIEAARCIGCRLCVLSCPLGAIQFDREKEISFKCELCDGRPECTAYCPTGALQFQEIETTQAEKREGLLRRLVEVYDPIRSGK
jgi:carbon-monoxide dehydrogenase iron sulfur subunit